MAEPKVATETGRTELFQIMLDNGKKELAEGVWDYYPATENTPEILVYPVTPDGGQTVRFKAIAADYRDADPNSWAEGKLASEAVFMLLGRRELHKDVVTATTDHEKITAALNSIDVFGKDTPENLRREAALLLQHVWEGLDAEYPQIKAYFDLRDECARTLAKLSPDHHWQASDGTVYQVDRWKGQYVTAKEFTVNRTRKPGEKAGDLSLTAARELGYVVEGKGPAPKDVPE